MLSPYGRRKVSYVLLLALPAFSGCGERHTEPAPVVRTQVTAMGRIVPGRGVVAIAGPLGERVEKLDVTEGQRVVAGARLAQLSSYEPRKADRDEAQAALGEAQLRMEAETRYAKTAITQAEAGVKMLEAQLDFDRSELARMTSLRSGDAISDRRLDEQTFAVKNRALAVAKARAELGMAEASLARTQAAVGLKTAEARVVAAEAMLEQSVIRAPSAGTVLRVLVHPGEQTSGVPILHLGDTTDMHVIAEVHANDIRAVRVGQKVVITSSALSGEATGTVDEVGYLIFKNDVLNLDPRAETDTRVVEVRIKVHDQAPFVPLTNLEVFVRIDVQSPVAAVEGRAPAAP